MLVTDDAPTPGPIGLLPEPPAGKAPGYVESLAPAFRSENTVGSILANEGMPQPGRLLTPGFDPFSNLEERYRPFARSFVDADNDDEVAQVKRRIDRELADDEQLAAAGWAGTAARLTAGLVDPINLVPVGGEAVAIAKNGGSLLRAGLVTARAGLLASTAAETVLHSTQETRTLGESASNIAMATFLSGVLGAGLGHLASRDARTAGAVARDLDVPPPGRLDPLEPRSIPLAPESVGAAATHGPDAFKLKGALGFEHVVDWTNPIMRASTSPAMETRRVAQELIDTPFFLKGNAEGLPSAVSVETAIKRWNAPMGQAMEDLDRAFLDYRGISGPFGRARAGLEDFAGGDKLSFREFRERVGMAMRRADADEIPQVSRAAKSFRRLVFDPLKQRAIEAKLLPEDVGVETAASYLSRVWNPAKLKAGRPEFLDITARWLRGRHPELDDLGARDVAEQIADRLLGIAGGRTAYDAGYTAAPRRADMRSGPLKSRTFVIPDEQVERFLDSDIEQVARSYVRSMAPDVELAQRFGSVDLVNQLDSVRQAYHPMLQAAPDPAARAKLEARRADDLRDLEAMRDRLRGTYAAPSDPDSWIVRGSRLVRNLNFLRMMGGMTLSAIPDLGRTVMTEGLARTIGDGLVPLIASWRKFRLAADEVKLAGTAWDMVLDTRALSIADIGDDFGRHSKLERGVKALTDRYGVVSLMAPWNSALKQFAGTVVQARILETAEAWATGAAKAGDVERLAQSGIGEGLAKEIAAQFARHGRTENGMRIANTLAWTNREAVDAFRNAVLKDTDRIIVTPGAGDRPLWMSTELGKMIGQFRSFAFASAQRVALAGLQQRDAAVLNGLALSVGLGAGTYALTGKIAGRDLSDDPRVWISEGIDRSGVTGWLYDANHIVEKATRGTIGVHALVGGPQMSRYASRNTLGAVFGPTVGTVTDLAQATGAAATREFSAADTKAIRRLLPWQNLFYLRGLLDQAEAGINGSLGIPEQRPKH